MVISMYWSIRLLHSPLRLTRHPLHRQEATGWGKFAIQRNSSEFRFQTFTRRIEKRKTLLFLWEKGRVTPCFCSDTAREHQFGDSCWNLTQINGLNECMKCIWRHTCIYILYVHLFTCFCYLSICRSVCLFVCIKVFYTWQKLVQKLASPCHLEQKGTNELASHRTLWNAFRQEALLHVKVSRCCDPWIKRQLLVNLSSPQCARSYQEWVYPMLLPGIVFSPYGPL